MPRPRRHRAPTPSVAPSEPVAPPEPSPVIPSSALVASAVRYPGEVARIYEGMKDWQREAYRHYRICGEARYAADFYGSALSRATLYAARRNANGELERSTSTDAQEVLDDLFAGKAGQAQMLKAMGIHLTVAGECYLIGRHVTDQEAAEDTTVKVGGDIWEVVSVEEMIVNGNSWSVRIGQNRIPVVLKKDEVAIRIWNPDPADRIQADSPFRALLPVLNEIEWLTKHIFAQLTSRLAGAGLLFMSHDVTFTPPTDENGKAVQTANTADALMRVLAKAMLTPLQDPSSPAAKIPTVMQVPTELLKSGKVAELLTFWSELDKEAREMRNDSIHRFALGMNLEPEQVLGMGSNPGTGGGNSNGVSHWGAWQIEESTIKMSLEPTLDLVTNALTIGYLRPLLVDETAIDEIASSTERLRLRPDRSKESMELYNAGQLKASVMVTENGFKTTDMPDDEEFKRWILTKIATGSATPEQVQAGLTLLGVNLPVAAPPSGVPQGAPRETRPPPSLEEHPTRPRDPSESAMVLLAAADGLVYRALERAGNRIRRDEGIKPPGVDAYSMHTKVQINGRADHYLTDAWSCAPRVLEGIAPVEETIRTLDAYCRTLFLEKAPHTRERLARWLEVAP